MGSIAGKHLREKVQTNKQITDWIPVRKDIGSKVLAGKVSMENKKPQAHLKHTLTIRIAQQRWGSEKKSTFFLANERGKTYDWFCTERILILDNRKTRHSKPRKPTRDRIAIASLFHDSGNRGKSLHQLHRGKKKTPSKTYKKRTKCAYILSRSDKPSIGIWAVCVEPHAQWENAHPV